MRVIIVEPNKHAKVQEINGCLETYQKVVGGYIEACYPSDDPIAIVCNEEGKLNGLLPNRALRDEDGTIFDVVFGTFLVVGLGEEDFESLSPETEEKYLSVFQWPEKFYSVNGKICAVPMKEGAI